MLSGKTDRHTFGRKRKGKATSAAVSKPASVARQICRFRNARHQLVMKIIVSRQFPDMGSACFGLKDAEKYVDAHLLVKIYVTGDKDAGRGERESGAC